MTNRLITICLVLLTIGFVNASEVLPQNTILYIGDSHSYGKLGQVIDQNLEKISSRVIMESSCGASASTWLGKSGYQKTVCGYWKKDGKDEVRSANHLTPKLEEEIIKYKPNTTIIQLGTNMAAAEDPSKSATSIEELMIEVKQANSLCIWIGPPDANSKIVTKNKLSITSELIKELAIKNDCFYIDSLSLTKFPENDKEGIHYPPSLSSAWGEEVSAKLLAIIENENNNK